jgi:hypothetical protein
MGLHTPKQLRPRHLMRRISSTQVKDYGEIYSFIKDGDLLKNPVPKEFELAHKASRAETFERV